MNATERYITDQVEKKIGDCRLHIKRIVSLEQENILLKKDVETLSQRWLDLLKQVEQLRMEQ